MGRRKQKTETRKKTISQVLRFMVGDNVIFKRKGEVGWHAGTVEKLWSQNAKLPDQDSRVNPYLVQHKSSLSPGKQSNDDMVYVEQDTEAHIRVMKHRQKPSSTHLCNDLPLPEPNDSLAWLYRPFPENVNVQTNDALEKWRETNNVEKIESVNDLGKIGVIVREVMSEGSTDGLFRNLNTKKECPTFFMPNVISYGEYKQEPFQNIISYIAPRIELRRPVDYYGKYNAEQLFNSIFPTEMSVKELETEIERMENSVSSLSTANSNLRRCQKLLNLGDSLLFLFRPLQCERDFERANVCYTAAAFDISEKDARQPFGHLVGLPEAMCAFATTLHYSTERFVYSMMNNMDLASVPPAGGERPMLGMDQIIAGALKYPRARENISLTASHLVSAIHRGWYSLLAFLYGKALNNNGIADRINSVWTNLKDQANIECLQMAHRCHLNVNANKEKQLAELRFTTYGVPSEEAISAFAPKVEDILRSIPLHSHRNNSKQDILQLNVSFFQIHIPSNPVCVLVLCPSTDLIEIFRIPDELQLFPFSNDSFEWLWYRIAYLIHLGIEKSCDSASNDNRNPYQNRVRPKTFKLKNVAGDVHFSGYLQRKCLLLPGTKVEFIEVDEHSMDDEMGFYDEDRSLWWKDVRVAIKQLQSRESTKRSSSFFTSLNRSHESNLNMMRSSLSSDLVAETSQEVKRVVEKATEMKKNGNLAFGSFKFELARKYFVFAISELRRIREPPSEVLAIMGTLLSNFSICGLEMAKTQTAPYGVFTLHEVIAGCHVAIANSSIYKASSDPVQAKLLFRRDLGSSRIPLNEELQRYRDNMVSTAVAVHVNVEYNLRLFKDAKENSTNTKEIVITFGKDMDKESNENACPICKDEFLTRLKEKRVMKLPCDHVFCAKCVLTWRVECTEGMKCAICNKEVKDNFFEETFDKLVQDYGTEKVHKCIPLSSKAERDEVLRQLFKRHDMDSEAVSKSLDDLLYRNNCGNMRQSDKLTHEKKQKIYDNARRPLLILEKELEEIQEEQGRIADASSLEFTKTQTREQYLRKKLHKAKESASFDIYSQMNSTGSMGRCDDNGQIQLDFHGLHVKEAKSMYDDIVDPILPIIERLIIITGRGVHSDKKRATLRHALQKYIKGKDCLCEICENNPGALRVSCNTKPRID